MKKQHIVLLLFSMFIVGVMFVYDYQHDYNPHPMTAKQHAYEIIVVGSIYTAIIYFILYGCYRAFRFFVLK